MGTRAKPMLQLVLDTIDFPKGLENSSNKPAISEIRSQNEEILSQEPNPFDPAEEKTLLDLDTFHLENSSTSRELNEMDNFCTRLNADDTFNKVIIAPSFTPTEVLTSSRKRVKVSYCEIDSANDDERDFGEDSNDSENYQPTEDELLNGSCSSDNCSECGSDSALPVLSGSPEPEASFAEERSQIESPDTTESPKKKGKKRVRRPETWKKAVRKDLRNSGRSYTSARGKVVKEKSIKPPCSVQCSLKCSTKISEASRKEIFDNYWKLGSLQRQRDFIGCCVEPLQLKYRRIKADASKEPRRQNCAFYLTTEGKRIRVCKTFILNTLAVSERTIRTIIQGRASSSGIVPEDKRGRHCSRPNQIDEEILNSVKDHIKSVPRIESHYLRASTSREFIVGGLTIAEMHRQYKQDRVSNNKPAASYNCYAHIFNTAFNIGFFIPKKDQCDTCEAYKNSTGEEKSKIESEYMSHQEEKELSRMEKAADKKKLDAKDSNIILAVVYDLQAVMPVPMGETSSFFYKARLNCFNFTVKFD